MSDKVSVDLSGLGALAGMGGGSHDVATIAALLNNRSVPGGYGDGFGFGGGGGALGLIALLALLGNRRGGGGLFGGDGDGGNGGSAVNQITLGQIQETLANISAAVPLSEAQLQTAIATSTGSLQSAIAQQALGTQASFNQAAVQTLMGFNNVGDKIDTQSTAIAVGFGNVNTNIERTGWQVAQTVQNDGEKTRALITRQYEDTLNRQLTDAKNEIVELRNESRRAEDNAGIRIEMINNQNQMQQQQQQQGFVLNHLASCLSDVAQIARATNTSIIAGNAGAVVGGPQTANPTNIR